MLSVECLNRAGEALSARKGNIKGNGKIRLMSEVFSPHTWKGSQGIISQKVLFLNNTRLWIIESVLNLFCNKSKVWNGCLLNIFNYSILVTLLDFTSKENMIIPQEPRSRTCLAVFAVEVRESRVMGPDQGTQPRTSSMCPSPPAPRGRRGCRAPRFSRSPYQPPHSARCLDSSQTIQGASE